MRLGVFHRRFGLQLLAHPLVVDRLRAGIGAQQFGGAPELDVGVGECRLGGIPLGDLLGDRSLERLGLDGEHDLAFLDLVAVGEQAWPEEAFDARLQVDLVDGGGAADEFRLCGDGLRFGRLHQHSGCRRALLRQRSAQIRRADQRKDRQKPCNNHLYPPASRRTGRLPHHPGTVTD